MVPGKIRARDDDVHRQRLNPQQRTVHQHFTVSQMWQFSHDGSYPQSWLCSFNWSRLISVVNTI